MRPWLAGCVVVGLLGITAMPALAGETAAAPFRMVACTDTKDSGGAIQLVVRGANLTLACSQAENSAADVKVMLAFDRTANEPSVGFGALFATRLSIDHGKITVTVPDLPEIAHHTMIVKVFVTDAAGTRSCDAGRIRVE
jgi:hypothetical protein